ncbi:MAG: hypothetical protein ACLFO2_01945 [Candidatus Woesearchaeota archaeon]
MAAKKCSICNEKVDQTFLQKPKGTWIRDEHGKRRLVCSACQRQHAASELKEKL